MSVQLRLNSVQVCSNQCKMFRVSFWYDTVYVTLHNCAHDIVSTDCCDVNWCCCCWWWWCVVIDDNDNVCYRELELVVLSLLSKSAFLLMWATLFLHFLISYFIPCFTSCLNIKMSHFIFFYNSHSSWLIFLNYCTFGNRNDYSTMAHNLLT